MTQPRVIGLDLSAECTGVALVPGDTTVIRAPRPGGKRRTLADDLARLVNFGDRMSELLGGCGPDLVVVEDYAPGIRSSAAHRLAEIGGVARYECARRGVPLALVNPLHLKQYATGSGRAEKRHMALSAYKRAGLEFATDDECDAWWLRAMGLDHLGHAPLPVPQSQRAALDSVAWPAALPVPLEAP